MIGRLIIADLKIAMLIPLLHDEDLIKKWDKSHGGHGLNLLRITLYFDLIRELTAISLDKDDNAPSIKNILKLLESPELLDHLKTEYIKPLPINWIGDIDEDSKKFWEEKQREKQLAENIDQFNKHYCSVKDKYRELEQSDLFKKIKKARDKLIAHYEMKSVGQVPKMLEPTDLGLKWMDVENYFEETKPIITNLVLIISDMAYSLDMNREQHLKVANDFWYK